MDYNIEDIELLITAETTFALIGEGCYASTNNSCD